MRKTGIISVLIGLLFITMAAALLIYNKISDEKAGEASQKALLTVQECIKEKVLLQNNSETDVTHIDEDTDHSEQMSTEMTTKLIDGYEYIGYLTLPSLDIELPVMSEADYTRLNIAPCRQYGSTKTGNLLIAGHNYSKHFGKLMNLAYGDLMLFTDMDGETTAYAVTLVETLLPTQVDDMLDGDWDVTLYTCTYGGKRRVTVRFSQIDPKLAESLMKRYNIP